MAAITSVNLVKCRWCGMVLMDEEIEGHRHPTPVEIKQNERLAFDIANMLFKKRMGFEEFKPSPETKRPFKSPEDETEPIIARKQSLSCNSCIGSW